MPKAWLIGLIIFSTYMVFSSLTYLSPYLSDVFKISMALISALSIIRTYAIKMGASPVAGILVDKVGSSLKVLNIGFIAVAVCELLFLLLPRSESLVMVAVLNMIVLSIVLFGFRGIYLRLLRNQKFPLKRQEQL